MFFEKFIILPHIPKLCPFFHVHGVFVKIIYLCPAHGQQERGMRGNDKLAAEKPRTVFQKFQQLLLFFRRQAVFRLVEQIERMFPYLLFKIQKCAFPIGMFPDIISQAVSDILGL